MAGRQTDLEGRSWEPRRDPIVLKYTARLAVGDQSAAGIEASFVVGLHMARTACSGKVQKDTQED